MLDVTDRLDEANPPAARLSWLRRLRAGLADQGTGAVAGRFASLAYLFRIANAGIAFLTQILLARWMGAHEFGIYIYVWTWVVLLGTLTNVGLASSAQRFIPTYAERGQMALLRGFIDGSRWLAFGLASAFSAVGFAGVLLFGAHLEAWLIVPALLALACLPLFVLTEVQDGIARTYDWAHVAMAPPYFVRPTLLVLGIAVLHVAGVEANAVSAMAVAIAATWITALGQTVILNRRLKRRIPTGPKTFAPVEWLRVSFPQFLVEGFYLLLSYCDVIILERFVSPGEVGVYYAATKLASLVAFVYFAVAAAAAHRFTELHVGERPEELSAFIGMSIRWTFVPSFAMAIVLLILGKPLLWLFGPDFGAGYMILAILLVGLLARASIGPVEKLLSMLGHQSVTAAIYALAFVVNIALNFALVPRFGLSGAAMATSAALVMESILLFAVAKRRLGLHVFIWGTSKPRTS
jgi:O-antigen/teichoic acid export membrane protein